MFSLSEAQTTARAAEMIGAVTALQNALAFFSHH
jgi:hypothetical protein